MCFFSLVGHGTLPFAVQGTLRKCNLLKGTEGCLGQRLANCSPWAKSSPVPTFSFFFYFRKTSLLRCNLHTQNFPFKMCNFTIYSIFTVYSHHLASPFFIRKILLGHSHSHPCLSVAVFTAVGELRGRALNRCVIWAADLRNLLPCLHKEGLPNPLFNALDRLQIYMSF